MARDEGLNVGLIRLITAWPFPYQVLREKAQKGSRFLVVEDSLGQMLEDVKLGIEGKNEVYFLGTFARETGLIFPERVMEEIRRIL
jgi:2-oxoglutarate ferredoxin oxidoreductase subunit alpha